MTVKISCLYDNYPAAENAVRALEASGVKSGEISIVASNAEGWYKNNKTTDAHIVDAKHDKDRDGVDDRVEGARTGAGVGGVVAGAGGLLAGLGVLAIPGIGPVVAAGWLASTVAGLVTGGVVGGAVGALAESGVAKEDADVYAEALRRGGALVVARVPEADETRYRSVLANSAVDVTGRAALYRKAGWQRFDESAPLYTPEEVRRSRELY
jgi:hypothetical protein